LAGEIDGLHYRCSGDALSMFAVSAMWTATHIRQAPLSDPFVAYRFVPVNTWYFRLGSAWFLLCSGVLPTPAVYSKLVNLIAKWSDLWYQLSCGIASVVTLTFSLGGGAATVGDLALMLGNPEIQVSGRRVNLNWREPHIAGWAWPEDGQFTYFEPVRQVSFGR
jgi:hypothetical protein